MKLKLLPIENGFSALAFLLGGMVFLPVFSVVAGVGWLNIVHRFAMLL